MRTARAGGGLGQLAFLDTWTRWLCGDRPGYTQKEVTARTLQSTPWIHVRSSLRFPESYSLIEREKGSPDSRALT